MAFDLAEHIKKLFRASAVQFENDWTQHVYGELTTDMNSWSKALFSALIEDKTPLQIVAVSLDFMVKRQEMKLLTLRHCMEMDSILTNVKKPVVVVEKDGKPDA